MKTILAILTISAMSLGCKEPLPDEQPTFESQTTQVEIHKIDHHNIEIYEIDGCQYVIYKEKDGTNLGYGYMAHKGNCNNPVHMDKIDLSTRTPLISFQKDNKKTSIE